MKKLLAILTVMSLAVAANAAMIVPKISIDNASTDKMTYSGGSANADIDMGYAIGVEYLMALKSNEKITVGAGLEYQLARKTSKIDGNAPKEESTGYYVPVYLTGQYCVAEGSKLMPYVKLNLGYSVIHGGNSAYKSESTLAGGLYYAAGIGATVTSDVIVELMYASFAGTRKDMVVSPTTKITVDDVYTTMSLKVGYKFAMNCKK